MLSISDGAIQIESVADEWTDGNGKESIFTVTRRAARKLSKDPVFNAAAYLKYCYGSLYSGEEDSGWIETIKDVIAILKEKKNAE